MGLDEMFSEKIKKFSNKVESFAGVVENFVENNVIEKDQFDRQFKNLKVGLEKFVKDNINFNWSLLAKQKVKIKKLENFKGELPKYQSLKSSGFDICAQLDSPVSLSPGQRTLLPTGLSFEIPNGFELQARPRSGWSIKEGITLLNSPGTIDSDYRGEVKIIVINLGQNTVEIKDQDRIAQLVLAPVASAMFEIVEDLGNTERGEGGFGSTGAN